MNFPLIFLFPFEVHLTSLIHVCEFCQALSNYWLQTLLSLVDLTLRVNILVFLLKPMLTVL